MQLRATDNAGHVTETSQTVWVDTQLPQSAFTNPPEGSEVWASGILDLAGISADATSGLARVEIAHDGGGNWQTLSHNPDGSWAENWDTRTVSNGAYTLLARAQDMAGNLETTARITVHVDNAPPSINIPGSWYIWEPVSIAVRDSGIGVDNVRLTIHGGSYGSRTYTWSNPSLIPDDFIWDRRFGEIVAPIGEYPVSVEAWDNVGNRGINTGMILIPEPGAPLDTPTATPLAASVPPAQPQYPMATDASEPIPSGPDPSPTPHRGGDELWRRR